MAEKKDTKIAKLHRWSATMFHVIAIGAIIFLAGPVLYQEIFGYNHESVPEPVSQEEVKAALDEGVSLQSIQIRDHSIPYPEEGIILYEIRQSKVSVFPLEEDKTSYFSSKDYKSYSSVMNNLAIHNWEKVQTKLLLEKRAILESYFTWRGDSFFRIVAAVRVPDSEDKTKTTDSHLLVYDVFEDKREYVDLGDYKLTGFDLMIPCKKNRKKCISPIPETLVVEVVSDRDGDGEFDIETETVIPMKVDMETMKLVPILNHNTLVRAQDILDGKTLGEKGLDSAKLQE